MLREMGGEDEMPVVTFIEKYYQDLYLDEGMKKGLEEGMERGLEKGFFLSKYSTIFLAVLLSIPLIADNSSSVFSLIFFTDLNSFNKIIFFFVPTPGISSNSERDRRFSLRER